MTTTSNAAELVNAGALEEAIAMASSGVKQQPTNIGRRRYLAELLCIRGELERADGHLETLMMQDPKAALSVTLLRQLIRAETARRECWRSGRPPELLEEVTECVRLQLELLLALREESSSQVSELVGKLAEFRPQLSGTFEGKPFVDVRDMDDVWHSTLEVLTSTGKYYWIPLERVVLLEVVPPTTPRDLIWPQAHLIVRDGPEGEVYLPALYPKTWETSDMALKMGRATEWDESVTDLVQGIGLRMFWVGAEEKPLFDLTDLTVDQPETEKS